MIVGIIRRKPVLTHASIVCEGMLASVNLVNSVSIAHDKPHHTSITAYEYNNCYLHAAAVNAATDTDDNAGAVSKSQSSQSWHLPCSSVEPFSGRC